MADLEDVTLDGRPLQTLRVADLKAALEERGLSKSGQKNALIKRLKGALMLENLQRTSTAHIGLQPNSQIGEEMSQNSFIKQYLAKQQELLRQRLEREAREAYETNDQEDHAEVNNSTSCPPQAQDVTPALAEQHKPPGPSSGEGFFGEGNDEEGERNNEADMSSPPASGSVAMRVPGGENRPERGFASSEVAADSDDEDSDEAEEDGDDDDWDSGARRRNLREPARVPSSRERSGASCQPQQQHIPSLLSPQLRQPTPPPSPPPELSFPLPDTPKQSPPSPDVAPPRHSPSTSSSGSSSSGSRSSSPEPQRSGHNERKPGPLTLLARKMESEGAFSGAGWHGGEGEGDRHDSSLPSATLFPRGGPPEGLVSAITHTANTAGHMPFPMIPGTNQGVPGTHSTHIQVPVSVLKATATDERDRQRGLEMEREELERQERQRQLEQEKAMELERERALALELEEKQRALERERIERQQALEREEREKALQRERELALERERKERELVLERERQERELALERERQERELALAQEREEREQALARERKERELVLERERRERELLALAKEMEEREQALARERALERQKEVERQRALEEERLQKEREDREKREREEMERAMELERAKALERERQERERALEQERERALEAERRDRIEREKTLERERLEREKALEQERIERQKALEQARLERERVLEQERVEKEKALEQERIEKEKALERERIEREKALERERLEREKALELERIEREKAIQQERLERERALEQERLELERKEKERIEREKKEREREEKERVERKAALEKERIETERAEKERKERLEREKALEQEKLEQERALEKEMKEKERALKEERERTLERQRKEKEEQERALEQEKDQARMAEKERESHLPPSKRGREIGFTPLPTPPSFSTGPARKLSTEAGVQEDVHAQIPRSESQAAESSATMSPTPLSPQSSFKKFRFLRDSPTQPQPSSTSMVIKRPRTFSDTPQPQASPVLSPTSVVEKQQQQEGHRPSAEQEDRKVETKPEVIAGPPGPTKKEAAKSIPEDREQADSVKAEHAAKDSTQKSKVDESKSPSSQLAQRDGRDAKKEEKQTRRRSTSNDSSSSESDSESSSSRSSRSSASSQEETSSSFRGRKEVKPVRDSSPQHRVTVEIHAEGSKELPKASPLKRAISGDMHDTTADGDSHIKKPFIEAAPGEETQRKRTNSEREEEKDKQRQVKETGMESEKLPENSEETPKAFSARKISLSSNKLSPSPGSAEGEQESGAAAGRKRRWGSSTAVTAKKPSISITTDSLKSLIPDIRPCLGQEAIVDLHPEEAVLSGVEDEERERSDQDLQIRRTVTQVVHLESQENGQKEVKRSRHEELEEEDLQGEKDRTMTLEEKMDTSFPGAVETQSPSHTSHDVEINTVTPSDTLIRRSISQQKTGVSITIDDPVRTSCQPSPPRGKVSNIVHVCNLVRPFTLGQLKELLSRTGTLVEDSFWIDKIKSHCYVTYSCSEEAVATRAALHGVKWPQSNPKVLSVDFCQQDELDFHKGLVTADRTGAEEQGPGSGRGRTSGLPSLLPERDQWAEREREMERRERARAEREWDRDKVREFGKPGSEKEGGPRRSRSRERRRKERGKSKEKKTEKKEKAAEDPPAKLLDDLFRKTKAAPCIYWLPLTDEQFIQRETARAERAKEREKRRKEQEEEEEKKREEERKERMKAGGGTTGDRSEGEKDKDRERDRDRERGRDRERERERERENDKRRDGYRRQGGSGAGGGSSRRSRSRSDPRERRR
ncbi:apoptotic chromatin condensation inducer in the nucleus [Paralichthys olivaceus]|uniref:apoptotic chromatin condensation inducer in the nucleus n=1 Tax=Paralichthys olivaceus TaxID=8255 RepID=UPI0037527486